MLQVLLIAFATYILYNFIFRFVIPLVRVTRQVKRQVREFNQQAANMQGGFTQGGFSTGGPFGQHGPFGNGNPLGNAGPFQQRPAGPASGHGQTKVNAGSQSASANTSGSEKAPKPAKDDYLDFEEIK